MNVRTMGMGVGTEDMKGSLESKHPSEVDNIRLFVRSEKS